MTDEFTRGWWGWIKSSAGYSVRLLGRNNLEYRDKEGRLSIFVEPLGGPSSNIVVYTEMIPDLPERRRIDVVERLTRALRFAGWKFVNSLGTGEDGRQQ